MAVVTPPARWVVLPLTVAALALPGAPDAGPWAQPAQAVVRRAVVQVPVADLFLRPDTNGPLTDQARFGETLRLLAAPTSTLHGPADASGPLVQVETGIHYRGYARLRDLLLLPASAPDRDYDDAAAGPILAVTARFANVYAQPDVTRQNPLLVLPTGARLRVGAAPTRAAGSTAPRPEDERWLQVRLPGGASAYVQRGDVVQVPATVPPPTVACVLREALRHEGTPYLWGGRSTYGIDCSGLVANAFLSCGAPLPRDADQQAAVDSLLPVRPDALRPGDLLFFGSRDGGPGRAAPRVTHVGIFLGNGEFVHATTADRPQVQRSPFADARWQSSFLLARRHPGLGP